MAKLVKLIGTIILVIWQLPQVIVGFLVRLFTGAEKQPELSSQYDRRIFYWRLGSGISLSTYYIIVRYNADDKTIKHEKGHTIQSLYLGPLYLLVIGLPSLIWCGIYSYTNWIDKSKYSYYSFYTEAWADKLGGVTR